LVKVEPTGRHRLSAIYDEHVTHLLRAGLCHVEKRSRAVAGSSKRGAAAKGGRS
jgi:hypothetical protein